MQTYADLMKGYCFESQSERSGVASVNHALECRAQYIETHNEGDVAFGWAVYGEHDRCEKALANRSYTFSSAS